MEANEPHEGDVDNTTGRCVVLRMSGSVCVDAQVERVWAALSDLGSIHTWSPTIRQSYCVGPQSRGVDTVRVCELGGNVAVTETMTEWREGESFTYVGTGVPLVRRARNHWRVEAQGARTLVTTVAEVELRGGLAGRLLEPAMRIMSRRMGQASLASFKYLVEHGTPYEGKATRLLPVPSGC
jgi:carbon monoxide dehydrogenase subunit G